MKYQLLLILAIYSCGTNKSTDYQKLASELDSILVEDQRYRGEMSSGQFSAELWRKQNIIDSANLKRVREIIAEIGTFPGKSLVGLNGSEAIFFVLQHSPDSVQFLYYDMILEAGHTNELEKRLVAMYQDRVLMRKGLPQIYGTQIRIDFEIDSETGERIPHKSVWQIADTTNIDSLRMWNGLGPLEDLLNVHGISRWSRQ